MDKPQPMLVQQPLLLGTNQPTIVNFAQTKESPWEQMQALIPVIPCADEESSQSLAMVEAPIYEGLLPIHPPQLDVETFLFIAQGNMRPQRPNQVDKRGCFKCGAKNHWHKECPHEEKQPHLKPIPRFCDECMVSHLPLHCPRNPANQSQTNQDKGKSPLNVVQVIPSGTKDEMIVPIQVVTRPQAKENPELQLKESKQVPAKK